MGKRKSSQKAPPKPKGAALSTSFKCLFCHHDKSIVVKINKATMFGSLSCKICGQSFVHPINSLSLPIDVYSDWIDACEDARMKQPKSQRPKPAPDSLEHGSRGGAVISNVLPRHRDGEGDEEAEGEADEDEDGYEQLPPNRKSRDSRADLDDDEEDDQDRDDNDDNDARGGSSSKKRRTVANYDDDDDEDED